MKNSTCGEYFRLEKWRILLNSKKSRFCKYGFHVFPSSRVVPGPPKLCFFSQISDRASSLRPVALLTTRTEEMLRFGTDE